MKTRNRTARLIALAAFAASGACMADPGIFDGKDSFSDFRSERSRADVLSEFVNAKAQGTLPRGDADRWTMVDADVGPGVRGPRGSRYTGRTREEVQSEQAEYQRMRKPYGPADLYFGE